IDNTENIRLVEEEIRRQERLPAIREEVERLRGGRAARTLAQLENDIRDGQKRVSDLRKEYEDNNKSMTAAEKADWERRKAAAKGNAAEEARLDAIFAAANKAWDNERMTKWRRDMAGAEAELTRMRLLFRNQALLEGKSVVLRLSDRGEPLM